MCPPAGQLWGRLIALGAQLLGAVPLYGSRTAAAAENNSLSHLAAFGQPNRQGGGGFTCQRSAKPGPVNGGRGTQGLTGYLPAEVEAAHANTCAAPNLREGIEGRGAQRRSAGCSQLLLPSWAAGGHAEVAGEMTRTNAVLRCAVACCARAGGLHCA